MKMLLDQNLSHRLLDSLGDLFPHSEHVRNIGLNNANDDALWEYAIEFDFVIVSKDDDFQQKSFLLGHPPKVIWIRCGNCSTSTIEHVISNHYDDLVAFECDNELSFLALG